jgi:excisionase family DNA binding protein
MTDWLTPKQVADATKKHVVTVRRDLESGKLHGHQSGKHGHWRVHPDSVDPWVRRQDSRVPCCGSRVVPMRRRTA